MRLVAELNYPPCHIRMTSPRRRAASFAGDSIRTQRTLFFFGSRAPRRGRALLSRVASRRRADGKCAGIAASANRGRGLREGVEGIEGIKRIEGEDPSSPILEHVDSLDRVDSLAPTRSRYRSGRVAAASATNRTGSRQPNSRRPRLAWSLRFSRGFRARQRRGAINEKSARSLRDVFGHTASISRRRTS